MRQSNAELYQSIIAESKNIVELRQSNAELYQSIAELRKSQEETDWQLEKASRKLDEVGRQLGSIGINMGYFAEELFYTSLKDSPVLGGVRYDTIERNVHDAYGATEYDILLFNGDSVAIVEVKYRAHPKDLELLAQKKAEAFRNSYQQYAGHKLYLGLATTTNYEPLVARAAELGMYLLGQKGDHVELLCEEARAF